MKKKSIQIVTKNSVQCCSPSLFSKSALVRDCTLHWSSLSVKIFNFSSLLTSHLTKRKLSLLTMSQASNISRKPLPTFYISHGGGPCFFMDGSDNPIFSEIDKHSNARKWYENFAKNFVHEKPKSILLISAHWEANPVSIITNDKPFLLYDYYGFPEETYKLTYPCPHSPQLVERVKELLGQANIDVNENKKRGLDHGVFIPLKLMYPDADIPVVQLSLHSNLAPELHYKIGEALAPLRSEGVLIIGSGSATHNLGAIRGGSSVPSWTKKWLSWLNDVLTNPSYEAKQRKQLLIDFKKEPSSKDAHPREEHFIPIFVPFGAAKGEQGKLIFDKLVGAFSIGSWMFP